MGYFHRNVIKRDYPTSKFVILRSINSFYFIYRCHHVSRCGLLMKKKKKKNMNLLGYTIKHIQ